MLDSCLYPRADTSVGSAAQRQGLPVELPWAGGAGDRPRLRSPGPSFSDLKPQLKSSPGASGHAPGWEPPQRECPLQTMGRTPVTKINVALPKPEESPAVQFKNNLKNNSGEMITASAQKGLVLGAAASAEVKPIQVTLTKRKSGPKLFCTKVTFSCPLQLLPQI